MGGEFFSHFQDLLDTQFLLIDRDNWGVVQLAGRLVVTQEIVGSSPAAPASLAGIAQMVEHHVANVNVTGSNPVSRSIFYLTV